MNRLRKAVEQNNGQTLLGAALYFYDPIFLEVAAQLGYQVIWIEMEHAPITFAEAADRGPDIIAVAMVNEAWQMDEMLKYARFAPVGSRGYFGVSRAVDYGVH